MGGTSVCGCVCLFWLLGGGKGRKGLGVVLLVWNNRDRDVRLRI